MKKPVGRIGTILIIIATVILAGVAIFTAYRLYQLRQQPIAPNVPSSYPKAQEASTTPSSPPLLLNLCTLTFSITSTGTPTSTPTGTPTVTPTSTPTGTPNACGGTYGSNTNCSEDLYCYEGYCRNPDCPTDTDCICATATSAPTEAALPQSGTSWPTFAGVAIGVLVILGSLLLAF